MGPTYRHVRVKKETVCGCVHLRVNMSVFGMGLWMEVPVRVRKEHQTP